MMKPQTLPDPSRLRKLPIHYSWIDHRLIQGRHLNNLSSEALSLYLFLLIVADEKGLSYYGKKAICSHLPLLAEVFNAARSDLIAAQLIAWEHPFYQILELGEIKKQATPRITKGEAMNIADIFASINKAAK